MADGAVLRVRTGGRSVEFEPGTTATIGRDPACDVVIDNPNVSRLHAELSHGPEGWALRDTGSAQGTWVAGSRLHGPHRLEGTTEVRLGQGHDASVVVLDVEELAATATSAPGGPLRAAPGDEAMAGTVLPPPPPGQMPRPGGALRSDDLYSETVVTGHELRIECGGRSYTFHPGQEAKIGRLPSCDVTSTNPTVSREHAVARHDGSGWVLTDISGSGKGGIHFDGRRVDSQRLQGSMAVWLGDIDVGERVVFATEGTAPQPKGGGLVKALRSGRGLLAVTAVAVLALVLAGLALFLMDGGNPSLDNDELARGTVRIESDIGLGSGTVIDAERGLVLTNAHVVAPRAPGQALIFGDVEEELPPDPRDITVWVAPGLDRAAEPRFVAEVVAADGYLDLAVIRLTETIGGGIVEDRDLEGLTEIDLGDSDDVEPGDTVRVFGYPTIAESNAATLTTGVVSGSVADRRLGTNRATINISADIAGGNSGGLAADDDGRIVGVPSFTRERGNETINGMMPINFARELIDAALATGDEDSEPYTSEHVLELSGEEEITGASIGRELRQGIELTCGGGEPGRDAGVTILPVQFTFEGMPDGAHQDLLIEVVEVVDGRARPVGRWESAIQYPLRWTEEGCATATIPLAEPLREGSTYSVDFYLGPNYTYATSFNL